jgi:hypothetical protein
MAAKAICDYCGNGFFKWRYDQRFCGSRCHDAWHTEEKREAIKTYREMKAAAALAEPEIDQEQVA